jgi:hypothetical protein
MIPLNNKEEDLEILYIELEQRADVIKKLKHENTAILQERDETIEEYADELQQIKQKNEDVERKNSELRQEIKILYARIEENQEKDELIRALQLKNLELQSSVLDHEKVSKIEKTENPIKKTDKGIDNSSENSVNDLISQKNSLMIKMYELDDKYLECIKEMDELKNELILMKIKYAESETEKNEMYQRLLEKKKFSWDFFKFWKTKK